MSAVHCELHTMYVAFQAAKNISGTRLFDTRTDLYN